MRTLFTWYNAFLPVFVIAGLFTIFSKQSDRWAKNYYYSVAFIWIILHLLTGF